MHHQMRVFGPGEGPPDPFRLNSVCRFPKPRRVRKRHGQTRNHGLCLHNVPGRPRLGGGDRDIAAHNRIQQCRLPRIGRPDNRDLQTFANRPPAA